jgi:hypothetical protein
VEGELATAQELRDLAGGVRLLVTASRGAGLDEVAAALA